MIRNRLFLVAVGVFCALATAAHGQDQGSSPDRKQLKQFLADRNGAYAGELEAYLQDWLVRQYPERAESAWQRDYSGVEAFLASVEPNRKRWSEVLKPPALKPVGGLERHPHAPLADLGGEWLTLDLGMLKAEAALVMPKNLQKPVPLIIAQHGIGSTPETPFGVPDPEDAYHAYARRLVDEGFAVLAPFNLREVGPRNRVERLCSLADTTLPGIELARMRCMLDEVLADPRIDAERVGMWGVSLGGMATMFWMPLEQRIRAGVVCAWFNHRRNKMAIPDERYSCFLETEEEHAFFRGWLTEFSDCDVISLICPRPVLVQHGKKDGIAWWPQVVEEFEASKTHYEKLGMPERIEMQLHEGAHEAHVESGVDFLKRWVMNAPD